MRSTRTRSGLGPRPTPPGPPAPPAALMRLKAAWEARKPGAARRSASRPAAARAGPWAPCAAMAGMNPSAVKAEQMPAAGASRAQTGRESGQLHAVPGAAAAGASRGSQAAACERAAQQQAFSPSAMRVSAAPMAASAPGPTAKSVAVARGMPRQRVRGPGHRNRSGWL